MGPKVSPPPLPAWKRVAFSAVVFVVFLFIIELSLSLYPKIYLALRAAPPALEGDLGVFCFGDSVTYGTGVQPEESWPSRLQARLSEQGRVVAVYNAGNPSDRWMNLPERTRIWSRYRVSHQRAVALIMLGHNDVIGWGQHPLKSNEQAALEATRPDTNQGGLRLLRIFRWIETAVTHEEPIQATLDATLEGQIREAMDDLTRRYPNTTPYLLTYALPGAPPEGQPDFPEEIIRVTRAAQRAYNAQLRELAPRMGVRLIDTERLVPTPDVWTADWFQDNIHLTPMGYDRVAEAVLTELASDGALPPAL